MKCVQWCLINMDTLVSPFKSFMMRVAHKNEEKKCIFPSVPEKGVLRAVYPYWRDMNVYTRVCKTFFGVCDGLWGYII